MTDKEKLKVLLEEWKVPFFESEWDIVFGRTHNSPPSFKIAGYAGFYTSFEFDNKGKFLRVGAWE